jgi:RNA polymerase sigma factor (TIGR02999 family)
VDQEEAQHWNSRGHFFAAAADAMRRILVDHARRRAAHKRGGAARRVVWDDRLAAADHPDEDVLSMDEALGELEQHDAQAAGLVKLRYFSGLSHQQPALQPDRQQAMGAGSTGGRAQGKIVAAALSGG